MQKAGWKEMPNLTGQSVGKTLSDIEKDPKLLSSLFKNSSNQRSNHQDDDFSAGNAEYRKQEQRNKAR
jgi:hypothetical protein